MSAPQASVTTFQRLRRHAFTGFGASMIGVLAFAVFFLLNFTTVVVSGTSMLPTFKDGRRLLATKAYWLVGPIRHNDIVVIREKDSKTGTGYYIKRVYRLEGETVEMVNMPRAPLWTLARGAFVVPKGMVYVLGDNREVSEDSRAFGAVDRVQIIGKVIHWP